MITIAIITLLIFLVLGVPVSFAIGLSGLLAIVMGSDVPSFMAVQQAIRGMNSFSLMAGPLLFWRVKFWEPQSFPNVYWTFAGPVSRSLGAVLAWCRLWLI